MLKVFDGDLYAFLVRITEAQGYSLLSVEALCKRTELMSEISLINGLVDFCFDCLSRDFGEPFGSCHDDDYEQWKESPTEYLMADSQAETIQVEILALLKGRLSVVESALDRDRRSHEWTRKFSTIDV